MIKAIRNFLLDQYLGTLSTGTEIVMANMFTRKGPHSIKCIIRPEVDDWFDNEMEGRVYIEHMELDIAPHIQAETLTCHLWFSRPEDAVRFRLTFAS